MKTDSAHFFSLAAASTGKRLYCRRRRCTYERTKTASCYKLVIVYLFVCIFNKQDALSIYSSYKTLKQKVTPQAINGRKVVPGRNYAANVSLTNCCVGLILCINMLFCLIIIRLSGDVHPNPGPDSFTESLSLSNNASSVFAHNLSIIHLNIQSILPKMVLPEAEMQNYDIRSNI